MKPFTETLIYTDNQPFPNTKARQSSGGDSVDGSTWSENFIDDNIAFFQGLLHQAGMTPNGTTDTATANQAIDAIKKISSGDHITFESRIYAHDYNLHTVTPFLSGGTSTVNTTIVANSNTLLLTFNEHAWLNVTSPHFREMMICLPAEIVTWIENKGLGSVHATFTVLQDVDTVATFYKFRTYIVDFELLFPNVAENLGMGFLMLPIPFANQISYGPTSNSLEFWEGDTITMVKDFS